MDSTYVFHASVISNIFVNFYRNYVEMLSKFCKKSDRNDFKIM